MNIHDEAGRIILPVVQFGIYALAPILLLGCLAVTPVNVITTRIKQMLSVPLLTSLLYFPYKYCDEENGSFSVFCQIIPFVMFLRFLDIFWIAPLLYKQESYITASELNIELWSSIRKDLKPHREKTKVRPVKEEKKKFYHLLPPIILNAVVYDALAAWAKTFSAKDILFMQKNNLLQSFVFFLVVVNALSCLLNFAGKVMQLLYCIAVEHGTYCPDNWRLMMDYPLLGLSLEEVWSSRWHRILRPAWVASAFKPLYYIVRTWTNENPKYKQLAIGLASMAVFVVSGMTHEYVVLCNTGWELYKKTFIGDQMIFFCTHGILVVLEKAVKYIYTKVLRLPAMNSGVVRMVLHCYVIGVCYYFFHYFINGIAHWGLWRLDKITPVEDIVRHYLLDTPYLRSFCGSLL